MPDELHVRLHTTPEHWTTALKAENEALKAREKAFRNGISDILQSRSDKLAMGPDDDDYDLGYMTCLKEITHRVRELTDSLVDS